MHMADALISPAVGVTVWAATSGIAAYSIKKIQDDMDEKKIPLMGVMGAFVFAAQMINFTIPGTGSSGHLGGGLMLAILLGPYAGFLTMAAILTIQALFFADGGLLALGSNIFNLGFFTCFVAYPFIYKPLISRGYSRKRILGAAVFAAVIGLQLGSLSVVLETLFSGKTELPFGTFLLLMQPIHFAIGIVEGLVIAAVVTFVWKERPEILENAAWGEKLVGVSLKRVLTALALVTVLTGGVFSWFASSNPDGLEWSTSKAAGVEELEAPEGIHQALANLQSKVAFLPDYGFKVSEEESTPTAEGSAVYPVIDGGTSTAGVVGAGLTLALAALIGFIVTLIKRRNSALQK